MEDDDGRRWELIKEVKKWSYWLWFTAASACLRWPVANKVLRGRGGSLVDCLRRKGEAGENRR
jgi:hypothetical protein